MRRSIVPFVAALLLATPALAQTPPAPATNDSTASGSFSRAWTDLKSSAANTWQGVTHGAHAAAHGVKKGWQATKQSANTPSND